MPGVFAGYEHSCKAWRIYVWDNNQFSSVKSRNVKFMEDSPPDPVLAECDLERGEVALFCPPVQQRDDDYVPPEEPAEEAEVGERGSQCRGL